jgi:hypothetical protein
MPNIRLKRYTGAAWEEVEVQTDWSQILNKPSTFTPTSHTHGNLTNAGGFGNSPQAIASGNSFAIVQSGLLSHSSLQFGSATTTFLRNDGTWGTPAGSGVSGSGTTNEIAYWTGTSTLGTLATATYPSLTELARVKGLSSAIQTQLDGKAPTSHATSATTYGVGTNTNYGHIKGVRLTGATDGESGVSVSSGIAYATKTLRVNSVAQQAWGALLDLDTTETNILRFVDLTITRTEGGITYYIGSIMIDVDGLFTSASNPTVTSATRWRLTSRNSSNTQLTLPIFMYRNTGDNTLRVYVDNSTSATYDYECVGYY